MRTKLYDSKNHRLLYLHKQANAEFWDDQWQRTAAATFANPPRHRFTVRVTSRYLAPGSRVLEGGCGLADVVYALHRAGYAATGVDFAPKVVAEIKRYWPHLDVVHGDVRNLPCAAGFYDGYWSIGVIEHFPEGYGAIAREMARVLRSGGYLFLSFPAFNILRKSLARAGKYRTFTGRVELEPEFYQFALDPERVVADFTELGFELVEHRGINSLIGFAEDSLFVATVERFLDRFPARLATGLSMAMDPVFGRYAGHSCLLVLRKKAETARQLS